MVSDGQDLDHHDTVYKHCMKTEKSTKCIYTDIKSFIVIKIIDIYRSKWELK